jgi:hypothetical protein
MKRIILLSIISLFFINVVKSQDEKAIDWHHVFRSITETSTLSMRCTDSVHPIICNSLYFFILDTSVVIPIGNCKTDQYLIGNNEDLFFCSNTCYNVVEEILIKKTKLIILIKAIYNNATAKFRFIIKRKNYKVRVRMLKM